MGWVWNWKISGKRMLDLNHQIDSAVNTARDEIVSFIQTLVQSPSLANDEGQVQSIILDKLESLGLAAEKVPVRFDELKDHPAFNDDGYSPDSRHNVVGHWKKMAAGNPLFSMVMWMWCLPVRWNSGMNRLGLVRLKTSESMAGVPAI